MAVTTDVYCVSFRQNILNIVQFMLYHFECQQIFMQSRKVYVCLQNTEYDVIWPLAVPENKEIESRPT